MRQPFAAYTAKRSMGRGRPDNNHAAGVVRLQVLCILLSHKAESSWRIGLCLDAPSGWYALRNGGAFAGHFRAEALNFTPHRIRIVYERVFTPPRLGNETQRRSFGAGSAQSSREAQRHQGTGRFESKGC